MTRILDFARERPIMLLALLAALVGAILGSVVGARRQPGPVGAVRQLAPRGPSLSTAKSGVGLIPIAVQLLSNPLIRYLLRRAISQAVARRLGH